MDKKEMMQNLVELLRKDTSVENIFSKRKGIKKNVGLVNHFRKHSFIPNKWFDWVRRADSPIMIVGQDWGPYLSLEKYFDEYEKDSQSPDFNFDEFLFKAFSSRTEKFILTAVEKTYYESFCTSFPREKWQDFIFTMAVLFTRQGKHFRGNEFFDEKKSAELSYPYVSEQVKIVQPKVILTLGNLAFQTINRYFHLGYERKTISEVISHLGNEPIKADGTIIIPNFHPAAHIDPKIQLNRWKLLWKVID